MTNEAIIHKLKTRINESLLPLITSDYVLWGLPYYVNPGDTLIWEGTLDFLRQSGHRCLGTCGWDEYAYRPLNKETVILVLGGGFFGDLWRNAWEPVVNTLSQYPDNPIVVLPQSIHYADKSLADDDARKLARCRKLTLCLRDQSSYDYAKGKFCNATCLLVPDMAFHVNIKKLRKWALKETDRKLYLKRGDKELSDVADDIIDTSFDVSDWPAIQQEYTFPMRVACALYSKTRNRSKWFSSRVMYHIQRHVVIRDAVRFISRYNTVYTTRLHVMILSFLLNKRVFILDNSYGKIGGCYRTWLTDCDKIKIYGR